MPDIPLMIAQLAVSDAGRREAFAVELYRLGCALGDSATETWRNDAEFRKLIVAPPTVGIAVPPGVFHSIGAAFGNPHLANVPPDQDAQEFELHIRVNADEARLDILCPRTKSPDGAIAKFLERFGAGIQQVEYFVSDVDRATQILRERFGAKPIYPQTRGGADGTRVNFFLAGTPDGRKVLIELVEMKAAQSR